MDALVWAVVALALVSSTSIARAEPRRHDGLLVGGGPNVGVAISSSEIWLDHGMYATSEFSSLTAGFDLRLGGALVPGVIIGAAVIGAVTPSPQVMSQNDLGQRSGEYTGMTTLALGAGPSLQLYPWPEQGFNIALDLGYAQLGERMAGPFLGFGGGYGFWIGDEWSVGPFARFLYVTASYEQNSQSYFYPSIGIIAAYN